MIARPETMLREGAVEHTAAGLLLAYQARVDAGLRAAREKNSAESQAELAASEKLFALRAEYIAALRKFEECFFRQLEQSPDADVAFVAGCVRHQAWSELAR
jgi:hypothetical protein